MGLSPPPNFTLNPKGEKITNETSLSLRLQRNIHTREKQKVRNTGMCATRKIQTAGGSKSGGRSEESRDVAGVQMRVRFGVPPGTQRSSVLFQRLSFESGFGQKEFEESGSVQDSEM